MNSLPALVIFLLIAISSCSICKYKKISDTEIYRGHRIDYYRINPKCPTNSDVKGYNKEGYQFRIYIFDSLRQMNNYTFYRDSVAVNKFLAAKSGNLYLYRLSYDSSADAKLTDLEIHVFNRLRNLSDSLGSKNLDYLSDATGFKLRSKYDFTTKKRTRFY